MIITPLSYNDVRHGHYIELSTSGNSTAISMPVNFSAVTVILSSVLGPTGATVEYSLSTKNKVLNDTAIWHTWSVGEVEEAVGTGGTAFDSPIAYLRVTASINTDYVLEVLS